MRPRSLGGCVTCRSRHTKCDEARPTCNVCKRANLPCRGYGARLSFDHHNTEGNSLYRRPLYSEAERKLMTESLVASVPVNGVDRLLSQLDRNCEGNSQGQSAPFPVISRGPFTVFDGRRVNHIADQIVADDNTASDGTEERIDSFDGVPWDPILLDPELPHQQSLEDIAAEYNPSIMTYSLVDDLVLFPKGLEGTNITNSLSLPLIDNRQLIPQDAVRLLHHFENTVIRILSPPNYQKSPWHILFSPCVMSTLGALTMGIQVSDAQLSIFYSVLFISSYNMRGSGSQDRKLWESKAHFFQTRAHEFLKSTMSMFSLGDTSSTKVVKYKVTLMALLGSVVASIFGGNAKHAEYCLLDAERVIRSKGLTKTRKSRKARLLHHFYTYLRVMHESTRGALELTGRQQLLGDLNGCKSDVSSFEPPFRLDPTGSRLDQSVLMTEKEALVGEQDLHLAVPGRWDKTLYPDIFGIPESWMQLLSQCIRLGNEVDISKRFPETSTLGLMQFLSRAKDLENCLIRWNPRSSLDWKLDGDIYQVAAPSPCTNEPIDDFKVALHQALLIYFFRRVYDMNPVLFQDKVLRVLKLLDRHSRSSIGNQYISSFLWPGFIAACETLDPSVQAKFSAWFDMCANRSGSDSFSQARKIAQRVWDERRATKSPNFSWREVLLNADDTMLFYS